MGRQQRHEHGRHVPGSDLFQPTHRGLERFVGHQHDLHVFRGFHFQSTNRSLGYLEGYPNGIYVFASRYFQPTHRNLGHLKGDENALHVQRGIGLQSTDRQRIWSVSSVTNMGSMFNGASSFNEPISDWNTSSVTDLNRMFTNATSFNQDLSSWEISNVTDMSDLFFNANALSGGNKGLIHSSFSSNSNWNTDRSAFVPAPASLTNANFRTAVNTCGVPTRPPPFPPTGISRSPERMTGVTSMYQAFKDKTAFDENITGWDVSNVTSMGYMFHAASAFNQPIGGCWNVSSVTNMQDMFRGAIAFNQPNIGISLAVCRHTGTFLRPFYLDELHV